MLFLRNIGERLSLDETAFSNGGLYTILTNKKEKEKDVTLDMTGNVALITKKSFPTTTQVIDRLHVQKLALDALQEIKIQF